MDEMIAGLPALADKPVKIIWGMKDPCFHPGILRRVAARFPQADVVEIANASHLVLEDAPEQSIAAVEDFLRSAAPRPSASGLSSSASGLLSASSGLSSSASGLSSSASGLYGSLQTAAAALPWVSAGATVRDTTRSISRRSPPALAPTSAGSRRPACGRPSG
jgi:hypothetical protein